MYVMCDVLEGWHYTDIYRIIQGCTNRCLKERSYQMEIINDYWKFLCNKTNWMHYFTNLFCHKTHMFWTVCLSIIRSLFAVHSARVYVIQVCRQLSSRTRMEHGTVFHPGPARKLSTNLYDLYHC